MYRLQDCFVPLHSVEQGRTQKCDHSIAVRPQPGALVGEGKSRRSAKAGLYDSLHPARHSCTATHISLIGTARSATNRARSGAAAAEVENQNAHEVFFLLFFYLSQ